MTVADSRHANGAGRPGASVIASYRVLRGAAWSNQPHDQHLAEWIRLTEQAEAEKSATPVMELTSEAAAEPERKRGRPKKNSGVSGQSDQKLPKNPGRPAAGVRAATRELTHRPPAVAATHALPRLSANLQKVRYEAAFTLQWQEIDCFITTDDELHSQLWEIDENLMRTELSAAEEAAYLKRRKEIWEALNPNNGQSLATIPGRPKEFAKETALERDEHVAEWVRLTGAADTVLGHSDPKPTSGPKGGRPKSGVRQAARELGLPGKTEDARRKNAERALKVAGLTEVTP